MISNRHAKCYNNVSQGTIAFKTSPYFSMGFNFKYFKYILSANYFHTLLLGYQKISVGKWFKTPTLAFVSHRFCPKSAEKDVLEKKAIY